MKLKLLLISCVCTLVHCEELEIRLKTASNVKPIYISRIHAQSPPLDWHYCEELRTVLENDLLLGGYASVLSIKEEYEEAISTSDARELTTTLWLKEKIPYVLIMHMADNRLQITAYNIEKSSVKRYPEIVLSEALERDRKKIHQLSDTIHRDLFGQDGIASLRLIYSLRQQQTNGQYASEIWISDSDGMNAQRATREGAYCITPSFYPHTAGMDNPPFYYISYESGQSKIYRAYLGDALGTPIVELRGNQALPKLNLKGSQMAFIADAAGRPDLFVQTFTSDGKPLGKSRQLFSAPRASQASPTFSPDSKKIAFVSDKDGAPRIYLMDITSHEANKRPKPFLITVKNRENTCPSWSPDGKKIAYSAKVEGIRQIWIYDVQTQSEQQLTNGSGNKENPCWSPDSVHLAYNTDSEEEGEIFLIDLHRKEPMQISKGKGQKRFPSFETR